MVLHVDVFLLLHLCNLYRFIKFVFYVVLSVYVSIIKLELGNLKINERCHDITEIHTDFEPSNSPKVNEATRAHNYPFSLFLWEALAHYYVE